MDDKAVTSSRALIWFRRNLRIQDNPAVAACAHQPTLGVFCIGSEYTSSWLNIPRCSPVRARFLQRTLDALTSNLQALGTDLVTHNGEAIVYIPSLCDAMEISQVHSQRLFSHDERVEQERMQSALNAMGVELILHDDYTLLHPHTVWRSRVHPVSANTSFSKFRKVCAPETQSIDCPDEITPSALKRIENADQYVSHSPFPLPTAQGDTKRGALAFNGGEAAALERLSHYIGGPIHHYKETRNEMLGADFSSKLSPWLNLGALSPNQVLRAVRDAEQRKGANPSTEWLVVELLWRDFFQFLAWELGGEMFNKSALNHDLKLKRNASFSQWCQGTTGEDFVDANMRELLATGYMSNRGRQNVASALIHEIQADWRLGAAWFEAHLLDYDPASNYGNWRYIAGLSANPRGGSWFNLKKQAEHYDPQSAFRRHWLKSQ
ncbi:DASH family cryptochrome [Aliidiomarina sanyensis]|uniref:DASH family cryptochrome n=1 Tax=Aliidiomarina sanyensis TaxID=1249555 RepID=UPI0013005B0D|nr:DASH family cryptochrome [Aliidiomarina sanyensis]